MKLLFIRHGQTDFNKNKIPQGQEIDSSLNAEGIQQVEAAIPHMPSDIDFIISSPLKRASQTADILNKALGKAIRYDDHIKELSYGSLAGKPWPEIVAETGDPDIKEKDRNMNFNYRNFGGEAVIDVQNRVAQFVDNMKAQYPDKTILVTTHGGVIDTMHRLFPQETRSETLNGAIHEFRF